MRLIMAFAVIFAAVAHMGRAAAQDLAIGSPAPDITLSNWLNAPRDGALELPRLRGKAVLIEFWGIW